MEKQILKKVIDKRSTEDVLFDLKRDNLNVEYVEHVVLLTDNEGQHHLNISTISGTVVYDEDVTNETADWLINLSKVDNSFVEYHRCKGEFSKEDIDDIMDCIQLSIDDLNDDHTYTIELLPGAQMIVLDETDNKIVFEDRISGEEYETIGEKIK